MSSSQSSMSVIKVGVSGHRRLEDDTSTPWYLHAQCVRILDRLAEVANAFSATVVAYSALAIGADQLFARAALGLGIRLEGVIPFADYAEDFEGADRTAYETLLAKCQRVHRLPRRRRSNQAYLEVGKWVVDRVHLLIAMWNGFPAAGLGGTGDIVAYARRKRRPVLQINPGWAVNRSR